MMRGMSRGLLAVVLVAVASCTAVAPSRPVSRARPVVPASTVEPVDAPPSSSAAPSPSPPAPLAPFDASKVERVLDDPRLADARALLGAGKALEAARAVARATPPGDAASRANWAYLEARLRRRGGDPKGALAAFARAAAEDGPLRELAALAEAEALEALGDHAAAARRARSVDPSAVPRARLDAVLGRSLLRSGDVAEGVAHLRAIVRAHPRGWPKLALELAHVLLAHPGDGRALEAAEVASSVELDAPSGRGADEARKLVGEARATLSADERARFDASPDGRPASRAQRLAASGQAKKALAILDRLAKKGELDCDGLVARADALSQVKRYAESSEEYGRAADACERAPGERELAAILYAGGRAAARGGRLDVARARYARIESSFPDHRLADDARLEGAKAALEAGDEDAFDRMLDTIVEAYPKGDVSADGLFSLGITRAAKGRWPRALEAFRRGAALPPERAYERAGRFRYFLGRALVTTGHTEDGRIELARVVREVPAGFYMAEAYARLEALEPGAGRRALDEARAHPSTTLTDDVPRAVLEDPAWKAAVALVEVDAPDEALATLASLGVADRSATPETLWAAARLLGRASDPIAAQSLLRGAFEVEPRPSRNEVYAFRASYPDGDARLAWQLAYPEPFAPLVARASTEAGVPAALLFAVMREESAFDPDALSKAGAIGLLQLMPGTARKLAGPLRIDASESKLHDPETNLRLGARFLAQLRAHFADDPALAIPGYNAGRGAPDAWTKNEPSLDFDLFVESIPYPETKAYTKRVISSLCAYEIVYGEPDESEALRLPLRARDAP